MKGVVRDCLPVLASIMQYRKEDSMENLFVVPRVIGDVVNNVCMIKFGVFVDLLETDKVKHG